jgi:hypothetical protein
VLLAHQPANFKVAAERGVDLQLSEPRQRLLAARLGDAHGDEALALKTLENGLARFPDARAIELARAYLYRAELAVLTSNHELAQSSLTAAKSLELTDDEKAALAEEFAHVTELVRP